MRIFSLCTGLLFCCGGLQAQSSTAPATAADATATTRPCSANPVLTAAEKKKESPQPKHPPLPEPAPACIEVKGGGLEIQEFLQNTAREQEWRIGENHLSEDTWSYFRYLDRDELEKYTNTKVLIEPIRFFGGKAAVTLRTTEIAKGYVRVQIIVHFQGDGKSTDKALAQPVSVWTLKSRGVMEQELLTALQTRYKPLA